MATLSFTVAPLSDSDEAAAVTPMVDGVSLVDLVCRFERDAGYEPAGGFAGIVPAYFNFGDLAEHFLGRQERQWPDTGRAWLLGCQCGEAGCWPLTARISLDASTVNWLDLTHEHRQERTYAGLGPYVFERTHYEAAVAAMVRTLRQ